MQLPTARPTLSGMAPRITERRSCAACGRRKLPKTMPDWKLWAGHRACHVCYNRALRGGDFFVTPKIRKANRLDLAARVKGMRLQDQTFTAICEQLGIKSRGYAHKLANL